MDVVKVICYGKEEIWASRERAKWFYERATVGSEGHERKRYRKILAELKRGMEVCSDEGV